MRPLPLTIGDSVAIVATARKISLSEIALAIKQLQSWGLNPVIGQTIGLSHHQFAGTDDERAADFQTMLDSPDIKAILCARGGYGTVRIVDKLDFSRFRTYPKWIIGFSDVTALHSHIHQQCDVTTAHATMPIVFEKNTTEALKSLHQLLFGETLQYTLPPHPLNRIGQAKGQLVGGNLSILYSLLGSPSDIDTAGKILFLEDLDEYLYHIDRMMMNLKRNGKLANLAALVVGSMTDMHDNTINFGKTTYEIIYEHIAEYTYPVVFNFPAGHIPDNRALIFGITTNLYVYQNEVVIRQDALLST